MGSGVIIDKINFAYPKVVKIKEFQTKYCSLVLEYNA